MKSAGEFERTEDIIGPEHTKLTDTAVEQIELLQKSTTKDISDKAGLLLKANDEHLKAIAAYSVWKEEKTDKMQEAIDVLRKQTGDQTSMQPWMETQLWKTAPDAMSTYKVLFAEREKAIETLKQAHKKVLKAEKVLGKALNDNKDSLTDDENDVLKDFNKATQLVLGSRGYGNDYIQEEEEENIKNSFKY